VGVALAREFVRAHIVATDLFEAPLHVACRNAARHGVSGRLRCIQTDLLAGVPGQFDAVVANPPYVPSVEAATLQPEVRQFEPPGALFAGEDGLGIIRRLVPECASALEPDGMLIFEFGIGQEPAITKLIDRTPGLELVEMKRDLQEIPRVAIARKI
jgi:release factor glutamine methyltransferase